MCTFNIKGLTPEDDGEYTCTAVNCAGEASLTVSIQRDVTGNYFYFFIPIILNNFKSTL